MKKITFSQEEIEALRYGRFHHPDHRVQLKMEVLYLKSQGVAKEEILRLCGVSRATFHRYLEQYRAGGIERLKQTKVYRPRSELHQYRAVIEADLRRDPPATVVEAGARIEAMTGIVRKPSQIRQFLRDIGMKPRKVGMIPAKANVEAQEEFKHISLEPHLDDAKKGIRPVYFVDAAHFVFAPFLGILWCFERLFVKAPSGRQRLNVLGAVNAITHEIVTVRNLTYITAETVCELLTLLAGVHPGIPITVVLDNARYQKCALVQQMAETLNIELLYLPPYSPNLNLIERLWKFVKKQCLYSKYYPDSQSFQKAIINCIDYAPTEHKAELESLLALNFQTFKEVPVVGEQQQVVPLPARKQKNKKVSCKAA
jgi:transposase